MTDDLDYGSIDGIDDADDDSVFVLIKDRKTDKYGWRWVYRDTLADHGLHELAGYGLHQDELEDDTTL
jgi:hypothetical protein